MKYFTLNFCFKKATPFSVKITRKTKHFAPNNKTFTPNPFFSPNQKGFTRNIKIFTPN